MSPSMPRFPRSFFTLTEIYAYEIQALQTSLQDILVCVLLKLSQFGVCFTLEISYTTCRYLDVTQHPKSLVNSGRPDIFSSYRSCQPSDVQDFVSTWSSMQVPTAPDLLSVRNTVTRNSTRLLDNIFPPSNARRQLEVLILVETEISHFKASLLPTFRTMKLYVSLFVVE